MKPKEPASQSSRSVSHGTSPAVYNSPACYLGEIGEDEPASARWDDVKTWRKAQRERLIARRLALAAEQRRERCEAVIERLSGAAEIKRTSLFGIYWPIRGEIDLRDFARRHVEAGGSIALPVIVRKSAPVEFWRWQPGARTRPGTWGIPVPTERQVVNPEVLIVPLVGFDAQRFRLGYGAGYYDRSLAAAQSRPLAIGVGFADAQLPTIHPQSHDIPMDVILTDRFRLP
jgi:5-formyltetrahydrofolate cyclo-ligase